MQACCDVQKLNVDTHAFLEAALLDWYSPLLSLLISKPLAVFIVDRL
jgi:hypothetical protein